MPEDRKLLEPLSTVVSGALRLLIALVLAGCVLSLVNGSVPLWGATDACVTADWTSSSHTAGGAEFGVRDGVQVSEIPRYCAQDPSAWQRTLGVLTEIPSLVLLIGGLHLLDRLLRSAARDGVHTLRTAAGLRMLAIWLVAGSLAAALAQAVAASALLSTLTTHGALSADGILHTFDPPYLSLLTGLGLLTFARITRVGAAMREDLESVI
ncbi:hypothetical protein ABZ705_12650 [Streptomyces sp. NPDC006984]|uniref:hypothetical protein n=1 Tax=Streptomyces sp. NPDC006984 TaxID=3155463 RepID=UPI0033CF5E59